MVWYRRTSRPRLPTAQRVLLHFGAVDYRAQVWVNGQLVATHEGGNTPFTADITSAAATRRRRARAGRPRRGRSARPDPAARQAGLGARAARIWYHRTTGIWQPVWLEQVADVHIERAALVVRPGSIRARPVGRASTGSRRGRCGSGFGWHCTISVLADDIYMVDGRRLTAIDRDRFRPRRRCAAR